MVLAAGRLASVRLTRMKIARDSGPRLALTRSPPDPNCSLPSRRLSSVAGLGALPFWASTILMREPFRGAAF